MSRWRRGAGAIAYAIVALAIAPPPAAAAGRAVTFTAADGTSLAGMLYEASNRAGPGVVLVHMLGRSKDEWAAFAEKLQDAGASVLAFDLRGHGGSSGNGAALPQMVADVRAAVEWMNARPGGRPGSIGLVGASLGANLAGIAAGDLAAVRAVAMLSPSLDYRGVRLDQTVMKKLGTRPVWFAASTDDPYALRTVRDLAETEGPAREQRLSTSKAHGTALLAADADLSAELVDWLKRTLVF